MKQFTRGKKGILNRNKTPLASWRLSAEAVNSCGQEGAFFYIFIHFFCSAQRGKRRFRWNPVLNNGSLRRISHNSRSFARGFHSRFCYSNYFYGRMASRFIFFIVLLPRALSGFSLTMQRAPSRGRPGCISRKTAGARRDRERGTKNSPRRFN
jgi:hypothetical protein